MEKGLIYTAAVLGSLCSEGAHNPGIVATVVSKLAAFDQEITQLVAEEQRLGVEHADELKLLIDMSNENLRKLQLCKQVKLNFDKEVPKAGKGRMRLEIPGTPWDVDAPLLLS